MTVTLRSPSICLTREVARTVLNSFFDGLLTPNLELRNRARFLCGYFSLKYPHWTGAMDQIRAKSIHMNVNRAENKRYSGTKTDQESVNC